MKSAVIVFALLAMYGTASSQDQYRGNPRSCEPVSMGSPNAPEQKPAFLEQRRACEVESQTDFEVKVLASGLQHPWAVEPLPDGDLLITERPGRMRIVTANGKVGEPLAGVPEVHAQGQAGLLDVALSPDFESDDVIFWSFSEPRNGGNGTSVARGTLSRKHNRVENFEIIFRAEPAHENNLHYGSRLNFDDDGKLYVTLGERSDKPMRKHSQQLDSHLGTIVRINPDGSAPKDNPFVDRKNARPEIWTLGHRNIQSAAFDAAGNYWVAEHGPRGGDELNLIEQGKNYGWPLVSYGEEYSGEPVDIAKTQRPGYEQPVYYWDPVIAPSGMEIYDGDAFAEWQGDFFIGGLVTNSLVRLDLENNKVVGEEHLLTDRGHRIRDVRQGPDGALYVVTDHRNGELWKIVPAD